MLKYPLEEILLLLLFGLYVIIFLIICTPFYLYEEIKWGSIKKGGKKA